MHLYGDTTPNTFYEWVCSNPVFGVIMFFLTVVTGSTAIGAILFLIDGRFARAGVLAGVASAFATLLLVGLTAAYAYSTQRLVKQNQQERHRPFIRELVGRGIDTILDILNSDEDAFNETSTPTATPPIPDLNHREVSDHFKQDLRRQDPNLVNQFDKYESVRRKYVKEMIILKNEIRSYLRNEFVFSNASRTIEEFVETLVPKEFEQDDIEVRGEGDSLSKFIEREATALSYDILRNSARPNPDVDRGESVTTAQLAGYLFDSHREEFIEIRQKPDFEDRIETLFGYRDEMKTLRDGLIDDFGDTRNSYIQEYDLLETELPPPDQGPK